MLYYEHVPYHATNGNLEEKSMQRMEKNIDGPEFPALKMEGQGRGVKSTKVV